MVSRCSGLMETSAGDRCYKPTHVGHNLDLLVLHLVEDVCVPQGVLQGGPGRQLVLQEAHKLLQLQTALLEVRSKLVPAGLVWWRCSRGAGAFSHWGTSSLANARPTQEDKVWEPHINFFVFEAWFTNAQRRLLGATIVYQMRWYVAHSQSAFAKACW